MTDSADEGRSIDRATQIIVAFLEHQTIDPAELPALIRQVRLALAEDLAAGPGVTGALIARPGPVATYAASAPIEPRPSGEGNPIPAVPVAQSIYPDRLISLEDGRPYRTLKRHLKAKYDMTPEDYRRKWGLPADYPMVAPDYSEARSEVAKRSGLGRSRDRRRASI